MDDSYAVLMVNERARCGVVRLHNVVLSQLDLFSLFNFLAFFYHNLFLFHVAAVFIAAVGITLRQLWVYYGSLGHRCRLKTAVLLVIFISI